MHKTIIPIRHSPLILFWALAFFLLASFSDSAIGLTLKSHHDLEVTFQPPNQLKVQDDYSLSIPPGKKENSITLSLHRNYKITTNIHEIITPELQKNAWKVHQSSRNDSGMELSLVTLEKPAGQPWPKRLHLHLDYEGPLIDPMRSADPSQQDQSSQKEGVLLSGASHYYLQADAPSGKELTTYSLIVNLPKPWKVVSQGRRLIDSIDENQKTVIWECVHPQEEIFLIADSYIEIRREHKNRKLISYLLSENQQLSDRYLNATASYLDFFEKFLSPYPYSKFALVENSRQTGYGMPSFTLLGSRIIRFPFILNTSYPHEILHNWWGNGVYIDPDSGNWAEGLTTYLSDHLLAELQGKGDRYRFQELMKYSNYVNEANDFPVSKFKGRSDMASQAVGYGKLVMVLNMLRRDLGDQVFLDSLRRFYETHKFKYAGFKQLRMAFEQVSAKDLGLFFAQWIDLKGAPQLKVSQVKPGSRKISFQVEQLQKDPAFSFNLPIAIWVEDESNVLVKKVKISEPRQSLNIELPGKPRAILLDPYYDVFRQLDRKEIPSSISQTYGANKVFAVLPDKEPVADLRQGYNQFAESLNTKVTLDSTFSWASGTSLWVLGKNNKLSREIRPWLEKQGIGFLAKGMQIDGKEFSWKNHSFVFTLPHPKDSSQSLTWVITDVPKSIPGLIRKLPHYGKFGYMVFSGKEPTNQIRNTWPANREGLQFIFEKGDYRPPKRPSLVPFKPGFWKK